jgi:hypothetical protein
MLPVILGVFAAFGLVGPFVKDGPPWGFFVLWFVMVGYLAINFLYRTSGELRFDDSYLFWRGFLRSGRVRLSDVVGIDTEFLGSIAVFNCRDGQRIRVVVLQGFAPFLTALNTAHPTVVVAPGRYARLVERAQLRWKTERTPPTNAADGAENE